MSRYKKIVINTKCRIPKTSISNIKIVVKAHIFKFHVGGKHKNKAIIVQIEVMNG